jgi:hypothetical protein
MSILSSIQDVLVRLPIDKVEGSIVFIELDSINYETVRNELDSMIVAGMPILQESKVEDIGKCIRLNYIGYIVLITNNKDEKESLSNFYIAFKTKI